MPSSTAKDEGSDVIFKMTPKSVCGSNITKLITFLFFFINLFIYLFMAELGLCCCTRAFSSCGEWGLLFVAVHGLLIEVHGLLIAVTSLVAEHGL